MRILKTNGKKSRPFIFDSSVSKNTIVFTTSKTGIESTIQHIMGELERYNIPCEFYTDKKERLLENVIINHLLIR